MIDEKSLSFLLHSVQTMKTEIQGQCIQIGLLADNVWGFDGRVGFDGGVVHYGCVSDPRVFYKSLVKSDILQEVSFCYKSFPLKTDTVYQYLKQTVLITTIRVRREYCFIFLLVVFNINLMAGILKHCIEQYIVAEFITTRGHSIS